MKSQLALAFGALLIPAVCLAAPLDFPTPEGWTKDKPSSRMRTGQYTVPAAKGDKEGGEVVIYHFGSFGGGSVDDNIARWKKQVAPGKDDPKPSQESKTIAGLKMTILDMTGTFTPPNFRGPKIPPKPDWRVINVVVETGEGQFFVKFAAPKATVAAQEKAFHEFLKNVKATGKAAPAKDAEKPTSKPS